MGREKKEKKNPNKKRTFLREARRQEITYKKKIAQKRKKLREAARDKFPSL